MARGRRARRFARLELTFGVGVVLLVPLLFVAAPGSFAAPFQPGWLTALPIVLATIGALVGLGWMIRIYRADPEPDQHAWRYRERR